MFCQFCLDSIFHVISWSSCTSRESWGRDLRSKFSNNSARSTWSGAVCRRRSSFSACGAVTPLMPTPCQWPRGNLTWSRVRVLPRTLWKTIVSFSFRYCNLTGMYLRKKLPTFWVFCFEFSIINGKLEGWSYLLIMIQKLCNSEEMYYRHNLIKHSNVCMHSKWLLKLQGSSI